MKHFVRKASFLCAILAGCAGISPAQQKAVRPQRAAARFHTYDAAREKVVEGSFLRYEPAESGRSVVQTASGTIFADLGPAAYLAARHFTLAAGDSVKLVGASSTTRQGTVLLVRMIEKGGQSLALRTAQGAPLATSGGLRRVAQGKRPESAQ